MEEDSNFMTYFETIAAIMRVHLKIILIYFSYICKDLHMTEYG